MKLRGAGAQREAQCAMWQKDADGAWERREERIFEGDQPVAECFHDRMREEAIV